MRRTNQAVGLECLGNVLFASLCVYLLVTDRYLLYVTPKMKPYLIFVVVVLCFWTLIQLRYLLRPYYHQRFGHNLILLVPAIFIVMPNNPFNIADISVQFTVNNTLTQQRPKMVHKIKNNVSTPTQVEYGIDDINKRIIIPDDERFYDIIATIYDHPQQYIGYQVEVKGFVYRDQRAMNDQQFMLARLLMVCCIADVSPFGLIASYEDLIELPEGGWYVMHGELALAMYDGHPIAQLQVSTVKRVEAIDGFLYPFN